jgi:hypothetical protein
LAPELRTAEYKNLLDEGFTSAFVMIERALDAVGEPGTEEKEWTFPDAETRDMAARIFGDSKTQPKGPRFRMWTISERMNMIRSMFVWTAHLCKLILIGL